MIYPTDKMLTSELLLGQAIGKIILDSLAPVTRRHLLTTTLDFTSTAALNNVVSNTQTAINACVSNPNGAGCPKTLQSVSSPSFNQGGHRMWPSEIHSNVGAYLVITYHTILLYEIICNIIHTCACTRPSSSPGGQLTGDKVWQGTRPRVSML